MKTILIKPMITKIRTGAILLFVSAMSLSCMKELDNKSDETQVTDASFWKTEAHLKMGVVYLYTYLPGITENNSANWSDDSRSTGSNSISDGSRLVPSTSDDYTDGYKLIRAVNTILEKSAEMNLDQALKDKYTAEARFFRAYAYGELLKRFGGVPLVLKTMEPGDPILTAPRSTREEVINLIYEDLDYAIQHLQDAAATKVTDYGRVNKSVAQALKVRVALFEGTFSKYHKIGDANKHLLIAKNTANDIMSLGYYKLFVYRENPEKSYYYLFQKEGDGFSNKENILPRLYGKDMVDKISTHNYSRNLEQGAITPTRYLLDAYLYKDGLPRYGSNRSPLYKPSVSTLTEFEDRDPRSAMTVLKKGDSYNNGSVYKPAFGFTQTGYKTFKYFNDVDWTNLASFTEHKVIRYAEILLSYAEASYELEGSITDADLDKSINLIRARAGMPKLTNVFAMNHNLNVLEEIRRERRVEFALEGSYRYWDIIRWKIAEHVLPLPTLGIQYFENEYAQKPSVMLDADGYVVAQTAATRKFDPLRDYLWPLPTVELGLNPKLEQNPEWK
ncbi:MULTISPECIES: RagB/SusD family nutrient uptake outer membrane protein [Sphingobacterium]|uniref:RagB/SusD family nutrient uptake outer membrane protein n=1 Tax=Sphingobacterium TaxID=28453 RepID=UPI0013D92B6C|nr:MULTISPECIES: RagB/SusD family nutrient uptake outer membrane protein [unclassified Sphingobacterium]